MMFGWGIWHMCGRKEPQRKFWRGNLGEREHVEDLGVYRKTILK